MRRCAGVRAEHDVGAGGVVARLDQGGDGPPLGGIAQGGDQQVDAAFLQLLQAVGRGHRHQAQPDAQPARQIGGEIGLDADQGTVRIDPAERHIVTLHADHDLAALADLVEMVGRRGLGQEGEQEREAREAAHALSAPSWRQW